MQVYILLYPYSFLLTTMRQPLTHKELNPKAIQQIAAYFKMLSDPTRLHILYLLQHGRYNVGELAQLCNFSAANISRHLSLLNQQGLITRHTEGTQVYYVITDATPAALCTLVCENIEQHISTRQQAFNTSD